MTMDNLATNVFAAFAAGQGQQDRRVRRNALARYADTLQPGQDPTPALPASPGQTNAFLGGGAGMAQPPIDGAPLPPAQPAGSPVPVSAIPAVNTTYQPAMLRSPAPASDPRRASAISDLVRMGDFETVNSLSGFDDRRRAEDTRNRIAPDIRDGRFGNAAREAAADGQTELATSLFQMDKAELTNVQMRGERGASALYSVLALPKEQRAGYMAQHQDLATDVGISPQQFASFDWSNDDMVRTVADKWQQTSKLAGDITVQRFGDEVHPVRTGPSGMEVLSGGVTVPETRAEKRDDRRIGYAETSDQRDHDFRRERAEADDAYRNSRAASEDAYRKWQQENPNSRGDVEGVVLSKAVREGATALSPEEKAIYDRYLASSSSSGDLLGLLGGAPGAPGAQPAPAQRPAPTPMRPARGGPPSAAGSQSNPARPRTTAEAQALPPGTFFLDPSGNLIQRQ